MGSLDISDSFNGHVESAKDYEGESHVLDMQQRARLLLEELEQFQTYLKEKKKEDTVHLSSFKTDVQHELKLLEKFSNMDATDEKAAHTLRSSNFTFFDYVWSTAKTCTGVTAIRKWFSLHPKGRTPAHNRAQNRSYVTMVDIVAQNGSEWVKVSSVTEKRIIWDLAKAGYAASSDDDDDYQEEIDDSIGLVKQVKTLIQASSSTRVRYRHPTIRLVLPRVRKDGHKQVRDVLDQIRALGVIVQTEEDIPRSAPVAEVLPQIAADRFASFSATINLDCTVLLAFVSDLSHGRVEPKDWHNKDIARQIRLEAEDQLLPNSLWPACGERKLVCTREAAIRMHEIVNIIGTETEKKRAALLIDQGDDDKTHLTSAQRIEEFQKLSDYQIPPNWNLPVAVIDIDLDSIKSSLPPVVTEVEKLLININQSVFLYGWSAGQTTMSSNGSVAKSIEAKIEENRVHDSDSGPDIWLCPTSRSLVGKEKERRKP
ncbi:hypothetical protein M430DRAFT_105723 [Amorphotheca resinae ATCC 22711]|uniref:DUF1308 domain-containing protein n=1 Tax=Amorphotheca resinae ATCC 22711 TaxID=857342 RepID=A0A2T3AWE8_AMORE|nr:hypothetical protein M430DRAFT_105723 [Amorphotheca resinae ATCC 22711]PSS12989.1 hypothetical protein M430DRAFT_105723 [Amorphotheca resinae ATCC 22711]